MVDLVLCRNIKGQKKKLEDQFTHALTDSFLTPQIITAKMEHFILICLNSYKMD